MGAEFRCDEYKRFKVLIRMKFLFIVVLMAGCASQVLVKHYTGSFTSSSDQIIAGRNGRSGGVEATFEQHDTIAILYAHFLESSGPIRNGRFDTLEFHKRDSGWHWIGVPNWKAPTTITQSDDSLFVAFGWGYGGESFYLKHILN